ncbi:MAG: hypothetical protein WCO71_02505 [Pseudomonadota bacterium]
MKLKLALNSLAFLVCTVGTQALADTALTPIVSQEARSDCHVRPVSLSAPVLRDDGKVLIHARVWDCARTLMDGYLDIETLASVEQPPTGSVVGHLNATYSHNYDSFLSPGWNRYGSESGVMFKVDGKDVFIFPERSYRSAPWAEMIRLHRVDL